MSLGLRLSKAITDSGEIAGFRYIRKRNAFVRKEPHGFSQFLWATYPTVVGDATGQHYSLIVGVRHDIVEDAVNQLGLIYGSDNQSATTTVDTPLEKFPLSAERQYSYFLPNSANEHDISAAASSIATSVENDLSGFYTRYASLQECAAGLNSKPTDRSHHLYNNLEPRMYRAIASAHLGRLPGFDSLLEQWQSAYLSTLPVSAHAKIQDRLCKLLDIMGVGPNNSFKPNPLRGSA
ncbi:hypothetical protein [Novilysobacter erysipheiresistens]|uniref:Uncharacterized protein n=1 Tax=Novilysobacter erysipheiresistens TaxID=1749332 RepID=A0ABU7Z251_9GAMM